MVERAADSDAKHKKQGSAQPSTETQADYCGIPLDEWKEALRKDVVERFGSAPADLPPKGEPGW
ncbi:hypothetical protein [Rhizobium sp. ZW T2_16]|uniref:hypothetical protein n=1 Tax=Rhizobium sp. ZW T2_16 TaxID=3378083 RepID=UPI003852D511